MAFRITGRTEVIALEQSFPRPHRGRGGASPGAPKKWYGFPRTPFDVKFVPRRDVDARLRHVTGERPPPSSSSPCRAWAARSTWAAEFLAALRKRCDEAGALLIFDEVQCGIGRIGPAVRGQPLRRACPT